MKKICLVMMMLLLASVSLFSQEASVAKGKDKGKAVETVPEMYVYGIGVSPADSVVYMTDIQILKDAQVLRKERFLVGRTDLSAQFHNFLSEIEQPGRTCAVVFSEKRSKISKDYERLKKRYTKERFLVKTVDVTEFQFIVTRND